MEREQIGQTPPSALKRHLLREIDRRRKSYYAQGNSLGYTTEFNRGALHELDVMFKFISKQEN